MKTFMKVFLGLAVVVALTEVIATSSRSHVLHALDALGSLAQDRRVTSEIRVGTVLHMFALLRSLDLKDPARDENEIVVKGYLEDVLFDETLGAKHEPDRVRVARILAEDQYRHPHMKWVTSRRELKSYRRENLEKIASTVVRSAALNAYDEMEEKGVRDRERRFHGAE